MYHTTPQTTAARTSSTRSAITRSFRPMARPAGPAALSRPPPARFGARLGAGRQPLVEIGADRGHQRLELAVEEVVGALHDLLLDHDALLGLELLDQAADVLRRDHRVLVAVDDQAGGRAGGEERVVVEVGGRCDLDEAL